MGEKRLPSIKIELDLYRTTKRPYRNLKINGLSTSPEIKHARLNDQTD